ncbi:MAG: HD-GYP domain-containing protein [Gemmatimonadota bacterium]|nr:HD domain-containing protein [Gemmatimonadota bacterium]
MTGSQTPRSSSTHTPRGSQTVPVTELSGELFVRRAGRQLANALYAAVKAIRLYPVENAAVQKAILEVAQCVSEILHRETDLELKLAGDTLFLNGVRLRLDLDNYASFSQLLSLFRSTGIGSLHVSSPPLPRDVIVFLSQLQSVAALKEDPLSRFDQLRERLESAGVRTFELAVPTESADEAEQREKAKSAAKRTYAQSLAVMKDAVGSVRLGKSPNIKKIKRVVQSIVDQILADDVSLLGLTTLRDYDEYTFIHSVNVCIFSVALGRRLGLGKMQLYDLGMAALLHDVGKARVPVEVLNKTDDLNDADWRMIAAHPWLGVLALMQLKGLQELPYKAMVVCYEHHMKVDLTGYPRSIRPRDLSIYSKIVAVADGFDAATSQRAYLQATLTPAEVLQEMRDNARRGMDPAIVKAFVAMLGVYPVGTLVRLDTLELALVHAVNPQPDQLSRPMVRIISDPSGNALYPGELADLTETKADGTFVRTVIKTENPERYGIRVGDYFV